MKAQRISKIERATPVTIIVNGQEIQAHAGESIAAALLAAGQRQISQNNKSSAARGYFCGMGMCFECVATVDGIPNVRTCITEVAPGCIVDTSS
ncbi:MAG: (2Fe-2S)-binding protein [Arenicellales bacterium]|nr:(2Fe-2S)-binding protein [Arenicellales bacterium]MDP6291044.1 (2Fe-2S)-binding protein [Arenicellales bacterium]MDP7569935.1 (2Fe-2S)-binding protein [Arenicellales bacterium]MEE1566396.1 (2Fe-2S)-binding protein [Arenicellales bacterium]HJL56008.1 (2Fe-2S)-binding protein [Arenicellales bacterium]